MGRAAWISSSPFLHARCSRSIPIERMLRTICAADSSSAKYERPLAAPAAGVGEGRRQAALAGAGGARDQDAAAAEVAAALEHLVERRDAGRDALGRDRVVEPEAGDRQDRDAVARRSGTGTRCVPCVEPRYLTTRRRRVETWSSTRWSSEITQSETYSSRPWRVRVPSPRSPVMTAVTPRSLSQRNRRRSSARRSAALVKPANSTSSVSRTTRLAPIDVDREVEAHEQALEVVVAGLLDLAAIDVDVVDRRAACARCSAVEVEAERGDVLGELRRRSPRRRRRRRARRARARRGPGTPCANRVLPQPGPPHTSVVRPRGSPPR